MPLCMGRTVLPQWTGRAVRFACAAECRAQIHDGLGEIGDARFGCITFGEFPEFMFGVALCDGCVNGVQTREHAFDVAVQNRVALAKGEGENRASGGAADAGQRRHGFHGAREAAAVLAHNLLGGFLQVARAGVVAESGPVVQHAVEFGARQGLHSRETFQKTLVIGDNRAHLGLLEHDLRYPDAVRLA